jgi:hypothetical protein
LSAEQRWQDFISAAVIPVLVTGIHRAADSGARGELDTGDKPRYNNCVRFVWSEHRSRRRWTSITSGQKLRES